MIAVGYVCLTCQSDFGTIEDGKDAQIVMTSISEHLELNRDHVVTQRIVWTEVDHA